MNRKMWEILGEENLDQEADWQASSVESKEKKLKKELKKSKTWELASLLGMKKSDLKNKTFGETYKSIVSTTKVASENSKQQQKKLLVEIKNFDWDFDKLQENLVSYFKLYETIHKNILKYRKIFKEKDHNQEIHEFADMIMIPLNSEALDVLLAIVTAYEKDEFFGQLNFLWKKGKKNKTNFEVILEKVRYFAEKISKKYEITDDKKYIVNRAIEAYNQYSSEKLDKQYFEDLYNQNIWNIDSNSKSKKLKEEKSQNWKKSKKN